MQSLVHSALHIWYLSLYFILTATVKIVGVSFFNFFIIIFPPPIVVFLFFSSLELCKSDLPQSFQHDISI